MTSMVKGQTFQEFADPSEIPTPTFRLSRAEQRCCFPSRLCHVLDINDIGQWVLLLGSEGSNWDFISYPNVRVVQYKAVRLIEIMEDGTLKLARELDLFFIKNKKSWITVREFFAFL